MYVLNRPEPVRSSNAVKYRAKNEAIVVMVKPGNLRLELPQQGLGIADFELARLFHIEPGHHAVFDQGRIALRTHTQAAGRQIEIKAKLPDRKSTRLNSSH